MRFQIIVLLITFTLLLDSAVQSQTPDIKPDIIVAADGSGDFKSVQEAVASIPSDNHQRIIVLVKDGVYKEKVRVDASCVTLRGESRKGAHIEFPQLNDDFAQNPDRIGRAVVNVRGDDFVLENITVENTAGLIGKHAFAVYGDGDRTVIVDSDVLSQGNDTVSLWKGQSGCYYHARCNFRGSVDFVCPRGWCYMTDCNLYETKNTAAMWHDGHVDQDMKFVMHNCKFDGVPGFVLARHHIDAQFYFLDCTFSNNMADRPPKRVIYPIGGDAATDFDKQRNAENDKKNLWGERAYFFNCHRDGGDFDWFKNNLDQAPGAPKPDQMTAAWTFAEKWNPENTTGPKIEKVSYDRSRIDLQFSESVTVKGNPYLQLTGSEAKGPQAKYASGSGTNVLRFDLPPEGQGGNREYKVESVALDGGTIIASQASAALRSTDLHVPGESSEKATENSSSKKTAAPASSPQGYKLVWSDEFDTDGPPDPKNWNYERGFVRNNEAQWYQPENAHCENGMLIIEARREQFKNPNYIPGSSRWQQNREFAEYTSTSMTTRGLHEWTYGRFEMRGRIDTRAGIWPAWWTLGRGRWPAAGEIDIMEYYRGMLKANIAWAGEQRRVAATWNSAIKEIDRFPADWSKQFHTWRMDWDDKDIKLFVDDVQLNDQDLSKTIDNDAQKTNPFIHAPQYMILNVAVGGDSGGDPSKTEFPSRMEVDYVRVYQKDNPKPE